MIDGEMGWYVPGTFNIPNKEDNTAAGKPIPQECVGKYKNSDILIAPSTNVEYGRRQGVESCLVRIRNDTNKIQHHPRIIYYEADNRGLTKSDLKLWLLMIL